MEHIIIMKKGLIYIFVISVVSTFFSCDNNDDFLPQEPPVTPPTVPSDAKLEKPAPLTDAPEMMIEHDAFIVSFNTTTLCPNYVAWHLTADRINGTAERLSTFKVDPDLPIQYQVKHADYTNSGYD